jgi:hypothetical protein
MVPDCTTWTPTIERMSVVLPLPLGTEQADDEPARHGEGEALQDGRLRALHVQVVHDDRGPARRGIRLIHHVLNCAPGPGCCQGSGGRP